MLPEIPKINSKSGMNLSGILSIDLKISPKTFNAGIKISAR